MVPTLAPSAAIGATPPKDIARPAPSPRRAHLSVRACRRSAEILRVPSNPDVEAEVAAGR